MCMVPYLQAEEDVRTHKAIQAELEEEATLMKGVKGWKVGESVYNSKKYWMPPTDVTRARQGFSVQVTD